MEKQNIDSSVLEMMASRICHDLISPVGAVNNGVEFLQDDMESGDTSEAIGLIAMSAQAAGARLQVFRIAYGAGGRDSSVKPADIHKVFEELLASDGKITQQWDGETLYAGYDRPEGLCKMLLCGLMLAQEALPKGGTINVTFDAASETTTITGQGTDAAIRNQVDAALQRKLDVSVIDPRLVHPYVIGILAAQYGFNVAPSTPEGDGIAFKITKI